MVGAPITLYAAPDLPAAILDDTSAAIAKFERMATTAKHPEVRLLTDVFVNRTGQIWNRDGQVFRAYDRAIPAESHAAEATAREIPQAVLAIEPHNNIFHWFAEWFPSLTWRLGDAASDMPVLIRDDAARFVRESLALGAVAPLPYEMAGDAILVRRLHLADPRLVLLAQQDLAGPLYGRVRERVAALVPAAPKRPLYISRRDTPRRPMRNERDLESALARVGFDIVTMSTLSLAEQIARVDAAEMVVGAHGAGLALLAAARPGRQAIEIVPSVRGGMQIRTVMANISRMVGHRHHLWLETMTVAKAGQWTVALDPFLALVDRLRAGRA
jgi:capsular polysaccharide biosynthesis protein